MEYVQYNNNSNVRVTHPHACCGPVQYILLDLSILIEAPNYATFSSLHLYVMSSIPDRRYQDELYLDIWHLLRFICKETGLWWDLFMISIFLNRNL